MANFETASAALSEWTNAFCFTLAYTWSALVTAQRFLLMISNFKPTFL